MAKAINGLPVFIKGSDISTKHVWDICTALGEIVGHEPVVGGHLNRGLWRVYISDKQARETLLLANPLSIDGQNVHVYGTNPFRAGLNGPDDSVTKITVKDLPLSYGLDEIKHYMEQNSVKIRKIEYGKARNPKTGELSKFLNGDRIIYADKLSNPLPKSTSIAGQRVRLYHDGQPAPPKDLLCTKCYGKDHTRLQCKRPDDWCKLCQLEGHKAGDDVCGATTPEPQTDVHTIYGYKDPLSNHFPCEIKVFGQTFASAEHAYKHTQAINANKPDIAAQILTAPRANQVKELSKSIPFNPKWAERKVEVMSDVLKAKLEQIDEFKQKLKSSKNDVIVGSAPGDYYWGSGLNTHHTAHTKQQMWPGENKLGEILSTLRAQLQAETPSSIPTNSCASNTTDPPRTLRSKSIVPNNG